MEKLKPGMILMDDCNLFYKCVDVLQNSAILVPFSNIDGCFAAEIMTFEAMEKENWRILTDV